mmetsp:Transcript_2265/g.4654  ORF Transcript_2265/g.4654 Transcript_2265/m.4654 type:complete len:120 (+) Transcript_2265:133-492(+)
MNKLDRCSIGSYDVSALIYLSDAGSAPPKYAHQSADGSDAESAILRGGAFAFLDADRCDRIVEPAAGRLLAFTSGIENVHQVRPLMSGERLAIAMWFTLSRRHRQPPSELELERASSGS